MQEIHLILQYFKAKKLPKRQEPDLVRQSEMDVVLQNNLNNPLITAVHLLTEERCDFTEFRNSEKIRETIIGERLTYQIAADYANTLPDKLCIICNCDIYFDETLQLLSTVDMKNKMFALLRWEILADEPPKILHPKRADMQDSWIFLSPLPKITCPYIFGVPGCENLFVQAVHQTGVEVYNPCFDIKSYHLHSTQIRYYLPRFEGTYYHPKPIKLSEIPLIKDVVDND